MQIVFECQIMFSWKNKKNISKCHLLKILPSVRSVNITINSGVFSKQHTRCIWHEAYLTLRDPITKEADDIMKYVFYCSEKIRLDISCEMEIIHITYQASFSLKKKNKNSAEGVIAPAGAKVTGATIRMWLLNKFISFLAVLTWKTGLKKM